MLWTTSVGVPDDVAEQQLDRRGVGCVARIAAYAVVFLESLQDRLVRLPGGDGDTHALLREQPRTARTDTGATPDDEGNIFRGILGHVASASSFAR